MNGMARSRRASKPVRATLAKELGGTIDGAWWPHSALIAAELPELIGALHRTLGEIIDIRINWSATEGQSDFETMVTGSRLMRSNDLARRPRLMAVKGAEGSAKLLVVPSMTSQALGSIVMRVAAGLPAPSSNGDAKLFDTAQTVMRLAEAESAKWAEAANI
ncbi:DUF5994 family protein [Mycobacterium sp. SMC-4]|uniref:DUF5994 family protein n=1 Tax=Mycobacterium sp. SMC-4 TaxID=2857059 RepID=UPI003D040B8E